MRVLAVLAVLAVTSVHARADTPCELGIELRGAIVDATLHRPLAPTTEASTVELALPEGGRLVELALRGPGGAGAAIPVSTAFASQLVTDPTVVGADPAIAMELADGHVRVVLQPIGREVTLVARWTAVATIRDGELQLALPAHAADDCRGTFRAVAGPGATISRVRVDAARTRGASAPFVLGDHEVTFAAELDMPRPVAWVQEEPLGDGFVARALTVAAPRAIPNPRRVVLVIDHSRSMQLVGKDRVARLVAAIAAALPAGTQVEAIAFDRSPVRLLGGWKPLDGAALAAIDTALAARPPQNGSDLVAALALAHDVLAEGARQPALVVAITDGVLGELEADALARPLGDGKDVDLHAFVLDPPELAVPASSAAALAAAIARVGGSYTELPAASDDTDPFGHHSGVLAPAWTLAGGSEQPDQLRAGEGFVALELVKTPHKLALTASSEIGKVALAPGPGPATSLVGQLALADAGEAHAALFARHPYADASHDLAVLATTGRVAANRRAMVAGGGPYTRMIEVEDPDRAFEPATVPNVTMGRATVIDRGMLQRLFELQLQPAAFRCFQRAFGRAPQLAGTVQFGIELGRGEVTHVALAGTGDAAFDSCLVDAAYSLSPPLIDPKIDPDDRTIANYPLTFTVRADKPVVVSGDADSSSPLDIDAIKGGVPSLERRAPVRVQDTRTPLGPLRPGKP